MAPHHWSNSIKLNYFNAQICTGDKKNLDFCFKETNVFKNKRFVVFRYTRPIHAIHWVILSPHAINANHKMKGVCNKMTYLREGRKTAVFFFSTFSFGCSLGLKSVAAAFFAPLSLGNCFEHFFFALFETHKLHELFFCCCCATYTMLRHFVWKRDVAEWGWKNRPIGWDVSPRYGRKKHLMKFTHPRTLCHPFFHQPHLNSLHLSQSICTWKEKIVGSFKPWANSIGVL